MRSKGAVRKKAVGGRQEAAVRGSMAVGGQRGNGEPGKRRQGDRKTREPGAQRSKRAVGKKAVGGRQKAVAQGSGGEETSRMRIAEFGMRTPSKRWLSSV